MKKSVIISAFLSLCLSSTFALSGSIGFTKSELELVKDACLAGSSFDFKTEADGSISVKSLEGKGKLSVSKKDVTTVDLPDSDKREEFQEIRACIKEYLLREPITSAEPEKKRFSVKLKGNNTIPGQLSGVSFDVYIDDTELESFSNLNGPPTVDAGKLTEGVHTFRFENINGYFMNPALGPQLVPQASGLNCDGEFTVARSKTYKVVVWLDSSGLTCDLR